MITNDHLIFRGGHLRVLREEDVHQRYVDGLNNSLVNRYLGNVKKTTQTLETVSQFVKQNLQDPHGILFGVWPDNSKNHCGTVRLHSIDDYHLTANIGICIFETDFWGQGIGTKSIQIITQWGIDTLKLRWIESGIYIDNKASQKAFLAANYKWICDLEGKHLFDGLPTITRIYAARNNYCEKKTS